jgi:hypothetical protein
MIDRAVLPIRSGVEPTIAGESIVMRAEADPKMRARRLAVSPVSGEWRIDRVTVDGVPILAEPTFPAAPPKMPDGIQPSPTIELDGKLGALYEVAATNCGPPGHFLGAFVGEFTEREMPHAGVEVP